MVNDSPVRYTDLEIYLYETFLQTHTITVVYLLYYSAEIISFHLLLLYTRIEFHYHCQKQDVTAIKFKTE